MMIKPGAKIPKKSKAEDLSLLENELASIEKDFGDYADNINARIAELSKKVKQRAESKEYASKLNNWQNSNTGTPNIKECEITAKIDELKASVQAVLKNQIEAKDSLINRLHDELEKAKQDPVQAYTDQLVKSVIKIRKDMKKTMEKESYKEMTVNDLRKEYGYIFDDISDLLELQNVDPFKSVPGDPFDRTKHDAKTELTGDPDLDKKIKESLSEGFTKDGRVIVLEKVVVYKYKEENN